jgi:hypothetical protein
MGPWAWGPEILIPYPPGPGLAQLTHTTGTYTCSQSPGRVQSQPQLRLVGTGHPGRADQQNLRASVGQRPCQLRKSPVTASGPRSGNHQVRHRRVEPVAEPTEDRLGHGVAAHRPAISNEKPLPAQEERPGYTRTGLPANKAESVNLVPILRDSCISIAERHLGCVDITSNRLIASCAQGCLAGQRLSGALLIG